MWFSRLSGRGLVELLDDELFDAHAESLHLVLFRHSEVARQVDRLLQRFASVSSGY